MNPIRVSLIQLAWSGSLSSMQQQYRHLIAQAAAGGAALVCLPELSLTPYFPGQRDPAGFDWAEPLPGGPSETFFAEMARMHRVTLIGSLFERAADGLWDTATLHGPDGALIGTTRKVHIPSGAGYHETDFFQAGDQFPVYDAGGLKIAAPTCYDQWFPELARIYALSGAQFIFYPTAIGSEPTDPDYDSRESWQIVMRGHAVANGVFIGAANRTGLENGVRFYGSSFICDPGGRVLAQAGRDTTEVISADLDLEALRRVRALFPLLHQRRPAVYGRISQPYAGEDRPPWLAGA
jgi:N-carbamoylputrescine amidase